MSEVIRTKIGRRKYELHLDNTGADPEWPWFVNAYGVGRSSRGFRIPEWFCAGRTRQDAIERVTGKLLERQA